MATRTMQPCYPISMSRLRIIIFVFLMVFAYIPHACAGNSGDAGGRGASPTKYLHTHHLPLVSGQFVTTADGAARSCSTASLRPISANRMR